MEDTYGDDEYYSGNIHLMMDITRVFFIFPVRILHPSYNQRMNISSGCMASMCGNQNIVLPSLQVWQQESDYRVCNSPRVT
jgi:hypothetical protein